MKKQAGNWTLSVDDYGTMTIYDGKGRSVADISECEGLDSIQLEALATEVLSDLGYEV